MIRFADMTEFHEGYQFFMLRPSYAVSLFIITITGIVIASVTWAFIAKMDDVVKATALLRPSETISIVKAISGGEVLQKNYTNDEYVTEGEILLRLDISADILELDNSKKLMERIENNSILYNILLETIRQGINKAPVKNEEAYIRSEAYLIEYRRMLGQIKESRVKLERERALPETLAVKERLEDIIRELEQAELQCTLWKDNQMIETMDYVKNLMQNKESLERRISDLERNIRNATFYAPIAGRINESRKLNTGDYLLPGEEIITIIPEDATRLKAELYIDPAYIARVKTGQMATLRFPGLPPSKFGKLEAEITLIPADYTLGPDSNPVFIVEAAIQKPWLLSPKGERLYLRAGISAMGRVIIDQDTVIRMILKKLDFINESYDLKALQEEKNERKKK